jgi:hypothetical protein
MKPENPCFASPGRPEREAQPIAFGVSFNLNFQSQSPWSLGNGTWQKRPRELDYRLRFEIEEMTVTLQMQWTVKPLGVYPLGPRSYPCGPTRGAPPPGDTLRAN